MKLARYEMSKTVGGARVPDGCGYLFWCPGCRRTHLYNVGRNDRPVWQFNGDLERPTFTPSLLVTGGCCTAGYKPGESCWCTFNAERVAKGEPPSGFECGRCHLFLTDGKIQFLGDCSHGLAGKTVDLPDLPEDEVW